MPPPGETGFAGFLLDYFGFLPLFPLMFRLKAENLSKRFGPRKVFSKLSFDLTTGSSLAIVGPNGSGKSTLIKTLLAQFHPTKGKVQFFGDDVELDQDQIRAISSFVAPYLNFYDHLTGEENLRFFTTVGGFHVTGKEYDRVLSSVGLEGRGVDLVAGYSSGMKQRLKYAAAVLKKPEFLFLDEPTSNLDEDGKQFVFDLVHDMRKTSIIILATNETEEYQLADQICRVDQ